jgi:hypothetical protein
MESTANLLKKIHECLKHEQYRFTKHALERKNQRVVEIPDILFVLRNGRHEKAKDSWDAKFQEWNYAIFGKTIDGEALRIIVSFDESGMLIITIIKLGDKS